MIVRRAYTLIEMLTVIVVLAIAAAMVVPSVSSTVKSQRKRDYLSGLERLTVVARNEAVSSGQPVSLVASEDGGFTVERTSSEGTSQGAVATLGAVDGIQPSRYRLNGEEVSAGDWQAQFYGDGTAEPAGIEISEGNALWHLSLSEKSGRGEVRAGELPAEVDERWEVGEPYVQRS